MPAISSVLQAVGLPPGSLAYNVIILFALEAMVGIAWEEWRRMGRPEYRRIVRGLFSLLCLRVAWTVVVALRWRGIFPVGLDWLWPPIEDLVLTGSLAILLWSVLPLIISPLSSRKAPFLFWVAAAAIVPWFVASAIIWRSYSPPPDPSAALYGANWVSVVWVALRLAITAIAMWLTTRGDGDYRRLVGAGFALLFLAQVAHLVQAAIGPTGYLSSWTHIGEIFAFPIIALALHETIAADLFAYGREFKTVSEESLRQTRELLFMLETSKATTSSLELDQVLDGIVENVVLALNGDQCAIAFPVEEDEGKLQIMATYDPLHGDRLSVMGNRRPGPILTTEDFPIILHALQRKQQVVSNGAEDNPALQDLFKVLGSTETGPLIVQPLVSHNNALGVLLLGNARSKRPFSQSDSNLCRALAGQVATAMENARLYQEVQSQKARLEEMVRTQAWEDKGMHLILNSAPVGILASNAESEIVIVNDEAARMLGRHRDDLLGESLDVLFPDAIKLSKADAVRPAWYERSSQVVLDRILTVDTSLIRASLAPVRAPDGTRKGVVVVLREVTEEISGELARSEFIESVAQELAPHLASLKGYTDLLLEQAVGPLNPTQRTFLEKARYDAGRMAEMMSDLADATELGPTGIEVHPQPVDLAGILAASTVSLQGLIEQKRLTVHFSVQSDLRPVMADPERLKQILSNLLDNALKYTPENGTITVTARSTSTDGEPDHAVISVQDTGVGIPLEEQERIFEPFYRTENPLSMEAGGAGLGLSIAKALVEAHGGRIWVESEPSVGSTFTIELPLVPQPQRVEQHQEQT